MFYQRWVCNLHFHFSSSRKNVSLCSTEPLTPADHALWQACVGMESSEYQTSTPNGAMTFELICRLLYQERPHSLVNIMIVLIQLIMLKLFVN